MYMNANAPNAIVTVNDLQSACLTDCSYTFISNVPEISSLSLSGSVLSLAFSSSTMSFTLSDTTVSFDNQECTVNTGGALAGFTCQLTNNTDGTPILCAGDHMPSVMVKDIGKIQPSSSVTAVNVPLTVTSITPNTGGKNGG
eukprot:GHVR01101009.1.p1 GENE.GHVR01101009.1~~GHVR01101009.1.p1  ORF type:complete len:142 (-),score=7.56 GHVR01101009.1:8247-8672(-)